MKRINLIIIMMLLSFGAFAQKIDADFSQIREMKVSGKTTSMEGHITFDGVDQLSMVYSNPAGDYFHIEGNIVKMNLLKKKAELDAEKVPMVRLQRSTLLNCLSGNWEQAAADNNAETTVSEENGFRNILIKAKGKVPKGGYSSVELTYRISDGHLTKMVLEEIIGVKNTYEIK